MDLIEARALTAEQRSRHPWEIARFEIVSHLLTSLGILKSDSTVCDVGCGDTFVAESLSARHPGIRIAAVDTAFDEEQRRHYQARVGSAVSIHASCDDIPESLRRSITVVLLMDVIEHVPDDVQFLRSLVQNGIIGPDTMVLITVPAYQSLFSSHDAQLQHYRRYSRASLRTAVQNAGLRVSEDGTFFFSLLPIRILQIVAERLRPKSSAPPGLARWQGGEARSSRIASLLQGEARVTFALQRLGVPLPGLSVFAVCERMD